MVERVVRWLLVVLVALALGACRKETAPDPGAEPEPPRETGSPAEPDSAAGDLLEADPEVVARDLEVPWDIAFAGPDLALITERPGRVRLVRDGSLEEEPVATLDVADFGEGGLLGIAVHPEWPEEPRLYLYYTHPGGSNRVSMFEVRDPRGDLSLGEERVILDGIPTAANHNGGRIAFGPDGFLYVTTGYGGDPAHSADPDSLGGKILRVDGDGESPPNNPFDASPVWAYGLRNPQGIAWDEEDRLYVADHGPTGEFGMCCLDEINLVAKGSFHGWPFRVGERDTGMGAPPEDPVAPIAHSGDDIWAPSGIAYLEIDGDPTILTANLRGAHVRRFTIARDDPRDVDSQDVALEGYGRLRHVDVGPDGCVYVLTSNRDGRGDPAPRDDRVLRLCG